MSIIDCIPMSVCVPVSIGKADTTSQIDGLLVKLRDMASQLPCGNYALRVYRHDPDRIITLSGNSLKYTYPFNPALEAVLEATIVSIGHWLYGEPGEHVFTIEAVPANKLDPTASYA